VVLLGLAEVPVPMLSSATRATSKSHFNDMTVGCIMLRH